MIFKFSPLLSSCITSLCKRVGGLFKQALNFLVRKEIFPAGQQTHQLHLLKNFMLEMRKHKNTMWLSFLKNFCFILTKIG